MDYGALKWMLNATARVLKLDAMQQRALVLVDSMEHQLPAHVTSLEHQHDVLALVIFHKA